MSANAERVRIKTALDPMLLTGAAFNGGRGFHPKATIADLIVLMFEAPNHDGPMGRATPEKFIESVLLCAADESELISQASHGAISGELERIGLRANWRARVALELANRMRAAAETSRGAS